MNELVSSDTWATWLLPYIMYANHVFVGSAGGVSVNSRCSLFGISATSGLQDYQWSVMGLLSAHVFFTTSFRCVSKHLPFPFCSRARLHSVSESVFPHHYAARIIMHLWCTWSKKWDHPHVSGVG